MHWHHTRNCNVNYEEKTKYHVQVQSHLPPNLLCRLHPTAVPNQIISLAEAVSQASLLWACIGAKSMSVSLNICLSIFFKYSILQEDLRFLVKFEV